LTVILAVMGAHLAIRDEALGRFRLSKDEQLALRRCLSVVESFRTIRRIMPLQHAYAFLLVASEEGRSVTEYAKRAGVTQAVMTRILSALGSRRRGRQAGYDLVQQAPEPEDARTTQTFLTPKGKAFKHEIVRMMRSDHQSAMQLRPPVSALSQEDLERDQWLFKLIAAGRKLGTDDIRLVVRQMEALIGHRESKKPTIRR
jgi:DNA-binding MarR family transcriptional regulator